MGIIPLFKSHYSIGKSILTLEKVGSSKKTGPRSILDICKENEIKSLTLVEDNFSSFLEAYINCKEVGINLVFGIKIGICTDMDDKSEESLNKTSKYILFAKNPSGYKKLIKLYSTASTEGFYYKPRIDFKNIKKNWSDKDLLLAIPFYDSFLFENHLSTGQCVPEFGGIKPVFFTEESDLPFDDLLKSRVEDYAREKYEVIKTRSIYYEKKEDFLPYLTFRCIQNRSLLDKPEISHFCSDRFCFEDFLESTSVR